MTKYSVGFGGSPLVERLTALKLALASENLDDAARLAGEVDELCVARKALGKPLDEAELRKAIAIHQECLVLAASRANGLQGERGQFAKSVRANAHYRPR